MALPNLARNNDRDLPSLLLYAGSFALSTVAACSSLYFVNTIAGLLLIPVQYVIRVVWCKEAIPISLVGVLVGVGIWTQPELVQQAREKVLAGWGKSKETGNAVAESMPSLTPLGYHPEHHPDSAPSTPSSPSPTSPTSLKTKKHHFHRHAASQRHADREEARQVKRAATMNAKVERMAARAEIAAHGGKVGKVHGWDMRGHGEKGRKHDEHREKDGEGKGKKHNEHGKKDGAGLAVVHEEDGQDIKEDGKPYAKAHFGMVHHHDKVAHEKGSKGGAVQEEPTGGVVQQVDGRVAVSA